MKLKIIEVPAELVSKAGFPTLAKLLKRELLAATAPKAVRRKWKTKDGRTMRICEMADSHLLNAIRYRMAHPTRPESLEALKFEAKRRNLPSNGSLPEWLARENRKFPARLQQEDEERAAVCSGYIRAEELADERDRKFFRDFGPQF